MIPLPYEYIVRFLTRHCSYGLNCLIDKKNQLNALGCQIKFLLMKLFVEFKVFGHGSIDDIGYSYSLLSHEMS